MTTRIQLRRDTAVRWASVNPVLAAGEPAVESDTGKVKVGDGSTPWSALPYILDVEDLTPVIEQLVANSIPPGMSSEQVRDIIGATVVGDGDFIVVDADDPGDVVRLQPGASLTEGLAAKQETATLASDTAAHVNDGSALDVALRAAFVSAIVVAGPGIDPTGVSDSTTAIQALINDASAGSLVVFPGGTFKLTAALTVDKSLRIVGSGSLDIWGGRATGFDYPSVSPYLAGTVLLQTAAGANGITIGGAGVTVDLADFGIRFADAISFTDSGHGIQGLPSAYDGAYDHGIVNAHWRSVKVYGHDGDHVAFHLTNPLLCQFDHLRSYGGGGLKLVNDSTGGHYGNSLFNDFYCDTFIGGSAHGIELVTTSGLLNLMQFNRPQVIVEGSNLGASNPTSAQKLFYAPGTACTNYTVIAPNFETTVGSGCDFGTGNNKTIDPTGIFGGTTWWSSNGALRTPAPTIVIGPGAGTSPAQSFLAGDDFAGQMLVSIGSSPPAPGQRIATVNWAGQGIRSAVQLAAADAYAGAIGFYVTNVTATGFDIYATGTPADGGAYLMSYIAK